MQVRGEGLADEHGEGLQRESEVFYVMHPNCAVEEM